MIKSKKLSVLLLFLLSLLMIGAVSAASDANSSGVQMQYKDQEIYEYLNDYSNNFICIIFIDLGNE